jgi:hypothetical protein
MAKPNKKLRLVEPDEVPTVDPIEGFEPLFLSTVELLDTYWLQTAVLLNRCLEDDMHGEMTLEDIYDGIKAGQMYALIAKNDDGEIPEVAFVFIFQLILYPQKTVMNITAMAGRAMRLLGTKYWKHVCSWAYMNGVREFQASVSPAMARVAERYGFQQVYATIRMDLTEM